MGWERRRKPPGGNPMGLIGYTKPWSTVTGKVRLETRTNIIFEILVVPVPVRTQYQYPVLLWLFIGSDRYWYGPVYNYWSRLHQPINDATNPITIHRRIFDSAHVQAHRVYLHHDHTPKSQQVVKSVTERGVLYWLHFMMMSGASGGENPPITRNDSSRRVGQR